METGEVWLLSLRSSGPLKMCSKGGVAIASIKAYGPEVSDDEKVHGVGCGDLEKGSLATSA